MRTAKVAEKKEAANILARQHCWKTWRKKNQTRNKLANNPEGSEKWQNKVKNANKWRIIYHQIDFACKNVRLFSLPFSPFLRFHVGERMNCDETLLHYIFFFFFFKYEPKQLNGIVFSCFCQIFWNVHVHTLPFVAKTFVNSCLFFILFFSVTVTSSYFSFIYFSDFINFFSLAWFIRLFANLNTFILKALCVWATFIVWRHSYYIRRRWRMKMKKKKLTL